MRFSTVAGSSALLLAAAASAFSDSSPILIWSSTDNEQLSDSAKEVTTGIISADAVWSELASLGCDWEVALFGHMDELHNSHLDDLDLPYPKSDAGLHIPYLVKPLRESLENAVTAWAEHCDAAVVSDYDQRPDGQRTLVFQNPAHGSSFKVPADISKRHLVVLTGTRDASLAKRQHLNGKADSEAEAEHTFSSGLPKAPSSAQEIDSEDDNLEAAAIVNDVRPLTKGKGKGHNSTRTKQPPFAWLTTPLLTCLLVVFVILLPILFLGIYMLVNIQVPPRMLEISKSLAVNRDRKEQ